MKYVRWFRAIGLAVISSMVSLALAAQAGDPTDLLLKKLNEQFVPTVFNQDETDIITPGTVVALKKDGDISGYIQDPDKPRWGLVVYRLPLKYCPISTYKKGILHFSNAGLCPSFISMKISSSVMFLTLLASATNFFLPAAALCALTWWWRAAP